MKRMIVACLILGVLAFGTRGWFTEANADGSPLPFKARAVAMARDADAPPAPTATPTLTPTPGATATPSPTSTATPTPTGTPTTPTATPSPTTTPSPTVAPPARVTFGNGTYVIGTDLAAGTDRTRVSVEGCYWERLNGFGGTLDEVIENEYTDFHAIVTIAPGDRGFTSDGCGLWTSDLSAITSSPTAPFGDGQFIVGTDIGSGLWKAAGSSDCYWERESAFSGDIDDAIANHFGPGNQIVNIAATDKGFKTDGCGTWTKS